MHAQGGRASGLRPDMRVGEHCGKLCTSCFGCLAGLAAGLCKLHSLVLLATASCYRFTSCHHLFMPDACVHCSNHMVQ
eukprot:SAG11_NODE_12294_length_710_cov_1.484452_1_plen_77_part_01